MEAAVIITGANQRYWHCLHQFLGNIEMRGIQRRHRIIAWDLGLTGAARTRLMGRYSWCEFRDFPFADYPPHVAMAAGAYAFKPLIVERMMAELEGVLFWFDSATLFRVDSLSFLAPVIRANGIYILSGQSPLSQRCDPAVMERLQIPFAVRRKPELAAGVVGFDLRNPAIRALVTEWARQARDPEIIAPTIPRLSFHRPEQALLSFLVYDAEDRGTLRLTGEEIDISSGDPVRWMRSRNFIGAETPLWAGPLVRFCHAVYKTVDQALWRLKHWRDTRLHGAHRRLKERFSVLLRDPEGKIWRLRPPADCYLADPILVRHQGSRALLVEKFDYRTNCGALNAIVLDDTLQAGPMQPILPRRAHASFPYTFTYHRQLYLVPETSAERSVEIHACEEFPARWKLARIVLEDIDAADSVIFERDRLWWLITAVREAAGRHLQIHFTDDPLQGRWQSHPINQARLWQDARHSSGRNAGAVIARGETLFRPAQSSRRFYGEGLQWMRIDILTPSDYRESPHRGPTDAAELIADWSPHHIAFDRDWVAFDIRDRARNDWGLPFRLKPRPRPAGDIPISPPHAKVH